MRFPHLLTAAILGIGSTFGYAQEFSPALRTRVDQTIRRLVEQSGVPSASVGIVLDRKIVFTAAYGNALLTPPLPASAAMHYPIGSITKQFTATCLLLLAEDGKLTLDDPVSRWFPELTRAKEVTVRELLSHTSGYEDYAPQDYTIPAWTRPVDPHAVVEEWARKPLDFSPGSEWQYSNTNFVLAALIVEHASGMSYYDFLKTRVFARVGITDALNLDTERSKVEPLGYERHALGPLRPAILEAPGWYFGDANLAMPVADLLRWDLSILNQSLLKPASYREFETEVKLKNGQRSGYALGLQVLERDGHRVLAHGGEVGGFVAQNTVLPDDRLAIVTLTNQEASSTAGEIAEAIEDLLLKKSPAAPPNTAGEPKIAAILTGLQQGKMERTAFTPDANFYFSAETLADFQTSLAPLGTVRSVAKKHEGARGGMIEDSYEAQFSNGTRVSISTYTTREGKIEQFLVEASH